ncbi:hypothetical protein ABPG74_015212 [Tetrahymena malaccensis]
MKKKVSNNSPSKAKKTNILKQKVLKSKANLKNKIKANQKEQQDKKMPRKKIQKKKSARSNRNNSEEYYPSEHDQEVSDSQQAGRYHDLENSNQSQTSHSVSEEVDSVAQSEVSSQLEQNEESLSHEITSNSSEQNDNDESDQEDSEQLSSNNSLAESDSSKSAKEEEEQSMEQNEMQTESDNSEQIQSEGADDNDEESEQVEDSQNEDSGNQENSNQSSNQIDEQNSIEEDNQSETERDENGRKKIYRRKAIDILKEYKCKVPKCGRLYGSYQALYTHLKTKHENLGQDKLYALADKERKRLLKLQEAKSKKEKQDGQSEQSESEGKSNLIRKDKGGKEILSQDGDEQSLSGSTSLKQELQNKQKAEVQDEKRNRTSKNKIQIEPNSKNNKKLTKLNKQDQKNSAQSSSQSYIEDDEEGDIEENQSDQESINTTSDNQQEELYNQRRNSSKRVKEIYVEKYMHLIKPGLVNQNQIKKLLKNKQQQKKFEKTKDQLADQEEDEEEEEMQIGKQQNKKHSNKEKTKTGSKVNSNVKINGAEEEIQNEEEIFQMYNQEDNSEEVQQKKGPGRPKKKKNVVAIRRTYGSVEQMIQKSINKQLALAEIKKQQRNLKLQKVDKKKISELNVFQPTYLYDLVKEIQLSSEEIGDGLSSQIVLESLEDSIIQINSNKNDDNIQQQNNKKKQSKNKKGKQEVEKVKDFVDDYPDVNQNNSFLLEPLNKQLNYVKNLDQELKNEEIQGIGLRLAYCLKTLSKYISKDFYQEMVYFMSYLLRILSIKKSGQYFDMLQDFLSIYEYMMNSIQYGGFVKCFPIFSQFTDTSKVYNFPKNIILQILKVLFKNNNAYSQNLYQQYYYYNQSQTSQF